MKRLIFSILTLMVICTSAWARIMDLGVTAGMNISKAETDDANAYYGWVPDSQHGWYAGLQFKFTFPVTGLGLDLSATYSQNEGTLRLASKDQLGNTSVEEVDGEVGFVTIPLHLRWDMNLPAVEYAVAPYLFTGPQASYAVKKLEERIDQKYNDIKFETDDLIWKWNLGMGVILLKRFQLSYAYEFPLSTSTSFKDALNNIEADYSQGTHRIGLTYFF